jgi:4-diphosphocytidyl-2-C-methyl-D-erythritol kinase
MIIEIAPAKVNLTLEILGKREDGYHEINSVMQTINIQDTLTFTKSKKIQLIPKYNNLPKDDSLHINNIDISKNLVYKATELLKKETGYSEGATIHLEKNIPSSAGLGGGSSDAASTLKGLNKLWNLNLSDRKLANIGAKIGSDVPFFIYGGTCYVSGRGEIVKKISPLSKKWLIIILLPFYIEGKTAKLYSLIEPINYSDGICSKKLISYIIKKGQAAEELFCNVFEQIYSKFFTNYTEWITKLEKIGIKQIHLMGSGPAITYITSSKKEIFDIVKKLGKETELNYYVANTIS